MKPKSTFQMPCSCCGERYDVGILAKVDMITCPHCRATIFVQMDAAIERDRKMIQTDGYSLWMVDFDARHPNLWKWEVGVAVFLVVGALVAALLITLLK